MLARWRTGSRGGLGEMAKLKVGASRAEAAGRLSDLVLVIVREGRVVVWESTRGRWLGRMIMYSVPFSAILDISVAVFITTAAVMPQSPRLRLPRHACGHVVTQSITRFWGCRHTAVCPYFTRDMLRLVR